MDSFLEIFGDITVSQIVIFCIALSFIYQWWNKVKSMILQRHEFEESRHQDLQTLMDDMKKYSKTQEELSSAISELVKVTADLKISDIDIREQLTALEDSIKKREMDKAQQRLLQCFRYYTDTKINPMQAWTNLESKSFWDMFHDYEEDGGDGEMHTYVQPKMHSLKIIDMDDYEKVEELILSRHHSMSERNIYD